MMLKMKRHSVTGQLPVHLEQTFLESPFTDTTEEEVDSHPDHVRQRSSPSRYIPPGPKMERAISFDVSSPPGRGRKRQPRRKRRCSNTKEELAGPTTLDPDLMDSKQALLPASQSPSHSPPSLPQQQTTPTGETNRELLIGHSTSGESTPRVLQTHELPITAEGDLSPAVAQFLESIKRPIHAHHNVRRSNSNGSLRTHKRQGSSGSTHSFRNPSSPLSGSPVKGPSQCNSTSSLSRSRRAPQEHTSSRRGSGSGIQYSKLDSSSSEEDDKEHETGTQSSDHNTTSEGQLFTSRIRSQANEAHSSSTIQQRDQFSSSRDVYSNESSGDAQCSDGGHDADGESDGNSLDLLSENEPNESNLESLHSPSNMESSDVTSTTPDILDSDSTLNLIPNSKSKLPVPHSPGHNVAMLITQFEATSTDSSLSNSQNSHHQTELPEMPLHIRRDNAVPLAESYSPKAVEDFLEGGE